MSRVMRPGITCQYRDQSETGVSSGQEICVSWEELFVTKRIICRAGIINPHTGKGFVTWEELFVVQEELFVKRKELITMEELFVTREELLVRQE